MSALKFECPGCGQHLECDRACSGDIIHCPRCCAELRIPFNSGSELPGSIARAELILHAPPPSQPASSTAAQSASPQHLTTEVICPVCQSELRVRSSVASKPNAAAPVAELIRKGVSQPKPPAPQPKFAEPHPDLNHMSIEERERQIATAREAHPIQLNPPIKPRLDYILSDEARPTKKAPDGDAKKNTDETAPPNTFTE